MRISHQHTVRHGVLTGCNSCKHMPRVIAISQAVPLSEAEWAFSAMSLLAVAYQWFTTGAGLTTLVLACQFIVSLLLNQF